MLERLRDEQGCEGMQQPEFALALGKSSAFEEDACYRVKCCVSFCLSRTKRYLSVFRLLYYCVLLHVTVYY